MADTINDLYLKYVNSVGSTLEDDRYFRYLFEIVQAGANTLRQNHQVLHKVVDERWLTTIEESLDALNRITEHPRRFITSTEELVPVELARKITAESVRHLSQNTQYIASDKGGEIHPTKVLNSTVEETYDLYENRFVYHLIQRLVTFIDKRTDVIFWSTGDETSNVLQVHSKVDDAYEQIEYNLELKIKNLQSFAENDSDNMQVFMRMVTALRRSAFCELMSGCSKVRSPIQRTNLITKDPDYRTCLKLWQFLENYDEIGYTIEERETPLEFDEEYQLQLFTNLITNYAVFKSLLEADARKLEDIPPQKRKVIKPKFIKQVQEEIVTDYNIPDVEARKEIVEEVTQAQLDAEAKLAEETALRQKAEEAQLDAEKALKEYRWQADFQLGEAERQAEDRLQKVKADAQAAQEAAAKREKELLAQIAAIQAQAEAAKQQMETTAAKQQAAFQEALEAQKQNAQEQFNQAAAAAAQKEAAMNRQMEQYKKAAQERLEKAKSEAAKREAALTNTAETAKRRAKESVTYAKDQQREAENAMKTAQRERDDALASLRTAQEKAAQETAARQALEKKLEGSGIQRFFGRKRKEEQETSSAK